MALIVYGGPPGFDETHPQAITIEIAHMKGYSRRPVFDGPTYLYTEYELHCRGIVNPRATSYSIKADQNFAKTPGELPDTTMRAIQHALMQPRRQLIYYQGVSRRLVLLSPHQNGGPDADFFNMDSANGPFPLYANNFQTFGTKSVILDFGIKTRINECPRVAKSTGGGSVMLSHRWTAERILDQDFYTTLIRRGHAYFDTAKLDSLGAVPDDYFGALLPQPDFGFKRTSVQAVAHEDGHRVDYVVIDREVPISIVTPADWRCTRIEAVHRATLSRQSAIDVAWDTAMFVRKFVGDVAWYKPIASGVKIVGGALAGAFRAFSSMIPDNTHTFSVRAWGTSESTRANLELICRAIIAQRMLLVRAFDLNVYNFNVTTEHDLMGKYVGMHASFRTGLLRILTPDLIFAASPFPFMPPQEELPGVIMPGPGDNPKPANDRSTRGHYIGSLVSRGLVAACEGPKGVVTGPGARVNRTP